MAAETRACKTTTTHYLKQNRKLTCIVSVFTSIRSNMRSPSMANSELFSESRKIKGWFINMVTREIKCTHCPASNNDTPGVSLSSTSIFLSWKNNFLSVNYLIFKTHVIAPLPFRNNSKINPLSQVITKA